MAHPTRHRDQPWSLAAVGHLPLIAQGTQDLVARQQRKVQLPRKAQGAQGQDDFGDITGD